MESSNQQTGRNIMIYVHLTKNSATVISSDEAQNRKWVNVECRHNWKTFEQAERIAERISTEETQYIATDSGEYVSPRYDVIEVPRIGDPVSYAFNGDSYPCGYIATISKTLKKITTTTGRTFMRRKQTGAWKSGGTWFMVAGHITERNPSF
jgi:hypothetical protein